MDNQLLVAKEELQPTLNDLLVDQVAYDPFKDDKYLTEGGFLLNRFSQTAKRIEDQRVSFTAPLTLSMKNINAFFKTFSEPIEQANRELRDKLAKHRRELEYKRLEEQMKVEEENKRLAKIAEETNTPIIMPAPIVPDLNKTIGAVTVKKVWTFEIKDQTKIPQEYLVVDEVKVRVAIRAGVRAIAGVTIFQKDEVSL
uniref:Uncharacterized protein n=1 Tax=viral metagenome TaxID=1070528 RepID=A0A6M3JZT2_9ZZZZ